MNKLPLLLVLFSCAPVVSSLGSVSAKEAAPASVQAGDNLQPAQPAAGSNPIIRDCFTSDPAAMVYKGTVYLYTGHDVAKGKEMYNMNDWRCYSSQDMKTWTPHGTLLSFKDFKWAKADAWASQVIEKNGKFYWYVSVQHDDTHAGKAIGVAVADSPTGPFKDARGSALVTDDMTHGRDAWDEIDPTVFTDSDGTSWLGWGHGTFYLAKLKPNMIELDGAIQSFVLPHYTEGPWIHKRGDLYYLSYAAFAGFGNDDAEKICYATATKITGPWNYRGVIADCAYNSYTIHDAIVEFKGQWYFFYHNGSIQRPVDGGGSFRRSVCLDYLYYNPDGSIRPIVQTVEGVSVPAK
jgi:beta-xylosidase